MITALYVLYIINCLFLVLVVLLQAGRGGGLAGLGGGGGGGGAVFGARGASTLLQKVTAGSAAAFMLLSIVIAIISANDARMGRGTFDEPASATGSESPAPASSTPAGSAPAQQAPAAGAGTTPSPAAGSEEAEGDEPSALDMQTAPMNEEETTQSDEAGEAPADNGGVEAGAAPESETLGEQLSNDEEGDNANSSNDDEPENAE